MYAYLYIYIYIYIYPKPIVAELLRCEAMKPRLNGPSVNLRSLQPKCCSFVVTIFKLVACGNFTLCLGTWPISTGWWFEAL